MKIEEILNIVYYLTSKLQPNVAFYSFPNFQFAFENWYDALSVHNMHNMLRICFSSFLP